MNQLNSFCDTQLICWLLSSCCCLLVGQIRFSILTHLHLDVHCVVRTSSDIFIPDPPLVLRPWYIASICVFILSIFKCYIVFMICAVVTVTTTWWRKCWVVWSAQRVVMRSCVSHKFTCGNQLLKLHVPLQKDVLSGLEFQVWWWCHKRELGWTFDCCFSDYAFIFKIQRFFF